MLLITWLTWNYCAFEWMNLALSKDNECLLKIPFIYAMRWFHFRMGYRLTSIRQLLSHVIHIFQAPFLFMLKLFSRPENFLHFHEIGVFAHWDCRLEIADVVLECTSFICFFRANLVVCNFTLLIYVDRTNKYTLLLLSRFLSFWMSNWPW